MEIITKLSLLDTALPWRKNTKLKESANLLAKIRGNRVKQRLRELKDKGYTVEDLGEGKYTISGTDKEGNPLPSSGYPMKNGIFIINL